MVTLQSIGDAVLTTNVEGCVTRMNTVAEQLTGWTETEAIGQSVTDVFHVINEGDRQLAVVPVMATLAEGVIKRLANDTVLIGRDGTERPIADSCAPIRNGAGGVTGAVLVSRDVTEEQTVRREMQRNERALRDLNNDLERLVEERTADVRQSEARFYDLFQSAPDAIVMVNGAGLIALVNERTETLFGYRREELLGQPLEMLTPASVRLDHVDVRRRYQRSAGPRDGVARAMGDPQANVRGARKDGSEFPAEISLAPLRFGDGLHVAAAVRDVTERVSAAQALSRSLREKELLLKEIHHRVKNNLQVISSLLAMQSDDSPDGGVHPILEESIHRVRSMALIHERLYQSETLERIDFGEYARSLAGYLYNSYRMSSNVQLVVEAAPTAVNIETAVPLGLVLNELVSNAFKYAFMDGSPGTLRVTLGPAGDGFALVVADTGPGCQPATTSRSRSPLD